MFVSLSDRIFLTACGEAVPNFGPVFEAAAAAAAAAARAIAPFLPSLALDVLLVVESVGEGCRFRIITVFGADEEDDIEPPAPPPPPLPDPPPTGGSHSMDSRCS